MKRSIVLIGLFILGCVALWESVGYENFDVAQTIYSDGSVYDVYTYSTGWSSIPKEAFSMETPCVKLIEIDSVKKVHMKAWAEFKKLYKN